MMEPLLQFPSGEIIKIFIYVNSCLLSIYNEFGLITNVKTERQYVPVLVNCLIFSFDWFREVIGTLAGYSFLHECVENIFLYIVKIFI